MVFVVKLAAVELVGGEVLGGEDGGGGGQAVGEGVLGRTLFAGGGTGTGGVVGYLRLAIGCWHGDWVCHKPERLRGQASC